MHEVSSPTTSASRSARGSSTTRQIEGCDGAWGRSMRPLCGVRQARPKRRAWRAARKRCSTARRSQYTLPGSLALLSERGRTLSTDLARALADAHLGWRRLPDSDVKEVLNDMVDVAEQYDRCDDGAPAFARMKATDDSSETALAYALWLRGERGEEASCGPTQLGGNGDDALGRNLWRVPTEREALCEQPDSEGQHRSVYRALFIRRPSPAARSRGTATLPSPPLSTANRDRSAAFSTRRCASTASCVYTS